MIIRSVHAEDASEWLRLREALWPEADPDELTSEIHQCVMHGMPENVFVAVRETGALCGLIETSVRPYANGCYTSPVGYIEGWYTDPDVRRTGVGRLLIAAAEQWAIAQGYKEMASDCDIHNLVSLQAHTALGYAEKQRVICLAKRLVE